MHLIIPNFAVRIAQGMCFRKRYGFLIRKCTGIGKNNAWNHPKHPSRYPRNLIQCHLLRAHSPRIYIQSLPNFLCPYLRACAFGKWWGAPSKMNGSGPKIRLKSPLAPQPVPQKLASMPSSKGPFSANIHPITPKLIVPIPEGMCFRKMVGDPFEIERIGAKNPLQITIRTPAVFSQTRLKLTFQRSFLHEYASDHSQLCCAYSSGHVLSKKVWVLDSKMYGYR